MASLPSGPSSATAASLAGLEETIRQIMETQVTRLGNALEARMEMRSVDASKSIAEAEHGWRTERQEREQSLMSLQRDMLTLTDSAVKERDLIEKVFQDVALVHSRLDSTLQPCAPTLTLNDSPNGSWPSLEARFCHLSNRTDEAHDSLALQREELVAMIESLAWQQQEEMQKLHRQALESVSNESSLHASQLKKLEQRIIDSAEAPRSSADASPSPSHHGSAESELAVLQNLRQLQQQMYEQFGEIETERAARVRGHMEFKTSLQDLREELCGGSDASNVGIKELNAQVSKLFAEVGDLRQVSATAQDVHPFVRIADLRAEVTNELSALHEEVRTSRQTQPSNQSGELGEICSLEEKLERFREGLTAEVQRLSEVTSGELVLERGEHQQSLEELRNLMSSTVGDSVHRIELLESDLIDMTRTLKRMDLRVKEVARASARSSRQSSTGIALPDSSLGEEGAASSKQPGIVTPSTPLRRQDNAESVIVTGMLDVESGDPAPNAQGSLVHLLEAARSGSPQLSCASDVARSDPCIDVSQQLPVDLIRRAARSNPGLNSMLRRARELGEI